MEEIKHFLHATQLLTPQQIDYIIAKGVLKKLKTNDVISKPDKVPQEIVFILKGVFRVFYIDDNGNEITKFLYDEHNFLADIDNFLNKTPSKDYIQAITKADILVFSRKELTDIEQNISNWSKVVSQVVTKSHLVKINLLSPMLHETATVRYENFIKNFPSIANKIPLSFIASFLGITQQSLSRIRKNLS
jgi:CRP-like cAMP-binding protein